MKLTTQDFLDKGYKKFKSVLNNADFGLQRVVRDEEGNKKYFLTVYAYDFSKYPVANNGFRFSYEVSLYTEDFAQEDGYNAFDVTGIALCLATKPAPRVGDIYHGTAYKIIYKMMLTG